MNAYYENTGFRAHAGQKSLPQAQVGDRFISFICAVIAFFTCSVAVKIEKATLCTALFFAFFGVIGGMDSGSLSMFRGLVLCAAISLIEFGTFKSLVKKNS